MENFFSSIQTWHWFALAAILLVIELVGCAGFLFWIGISATVTGIISWLIPGLSGVWEALIFSIGAIVVAVLWWLYIRKNPIKTDKPTLNRRSEQYIGKVFTLITDTENSLGVVRVGDSRWRVMCDDGDAKEGEKVKIISVDGAMLHAVKADVTESPTSTDTTANKPDQDTHSDNTSE